MHKLRLTAATMLSAALLMGCAPKPSIVGTWHETFRSPLTGYYEMTFRSNGTFEIGGSSVDFIGISRKSNSHGTYTYVDGNLTMTTVYSSTETMRPGWKSPKTTTETRTFTGQDEKVEVSRTQLTVGEGSSREIYGRVQP